MFQKGRNGIDGTFLSQGPPPKLTMIESKASEMGSFSYSKAQLSGGKEYFKQMLHGGTRYDGFLEKFEQLIEENPELKFEFIRVETDIKRTSMGLV